MRWAILWISISVWGCVSFAGNNEEIKKFYPLNVGNKWVYCEKKDTLSIDSIVIMDTLKWNGRKCYKQQWFTIKNDTNYKYHICWDGELREYNETPSDSEYYGILLKEPLKLNKSWSWKITDTDSLSKDIFLYKIESENIDVKVPAGMFHNCLKVSRKMLSESTFNGIFWFAPRVGMIKCTFPEWDIDLELSRYTIKD
jgi:hypothetical protein